MIESHIIRKIKQISLNSEHKFGFIAKHVMENSRQVSELTIKQLATATFCSPATINRFVNSIGLDGYKEFIYVLRYYNRTYINEILTNNEVNENNIIEDYFTRTNNCLTQTRDLLTIQQSTIKKIAQHIITAKKINIFAFGGTFNAAQDFSEKLKRLSIFASAYNDYHNGNYGANLMNTEDLAIFISYSGETQELLKLANDCKNNHTPIVTITKQGNNSLSALSSYKIEVISDEMIKRLYSTTSRLAILFSLDIIYLNLISFNPKEYNDFLDKTTIEKF